MLEQAVDEQLVEGQQDVEAGPEVAKEEPRADITEAPEISETVAEDAVVAIK
jgi:hypothetical protein